MLAFEGRAQAQAIKAELVQAGLTTPLLVTSPPADFNRLFILEKGGRIKIIKDGVLLATPFLNVSSLISGGGERGLLGLAFHPDYANNGRFFINYTNSSGNTRVSEYGVSGGDPDLANPTEVQLIFTNNQPFSNHNGGCIEFGPDAMLYIGMGDGGSANDPANRAQNPLNNLGKMHRFDVDLAAPFIPGDNPFVGDASTNDSIWALGLRNPWRFSFDQGNGDLYIGDVGQNAREEVDYVAAPDPGGQNFGWRCMEGLNCTGLSGCTCNAIELTDPVATYGHGMGCSLTGGYVYRGANIPGLEGTYFYGDYCSSRIWSFRMVAGVVTEAMERTAELEPDGAPTINNITSFGQDAAGNVYICDPSGGEIYQIVGDCNVDSYCMSAPNSTGIGGAITGSGLPSIGDNNFSLLARNLPPNVFGLFYYGNAQIAAPFGDGIRCVGSTGGTGTTRLQGPIQVDASGNIARVLDFTLPPASAGPGEITPGMTLNFQFWFRDTAGPGGTGFNLTDGLAVTFCP
ncbi:MAG: glucose/arabinose dehydrogenase [Chlamydiales bacterium]|jgi:glucose/arabinose dehydrogenase